MKRLHALFLTVLLLCTSCALAEDYSALTVEELTAMRSAINAELDARLLDVKVEAALTFTSADQFIYVDNGEEVMIRGYIGTQGDIVIPQEIGGLPVTRIAESAFKENSTIRSVVIPDSVVEIGESAFYSCKNLQKVVLSKNVTEIRKNTFCICSSLQEIDLDHVSVIGDQAFMYAGLTGTLVLRAQNLTIDNQAFRYCNNLTGVKIYAKTCTLDYAPFLYMNALNFVFFSPDTAVTFSKPVVNDCPSMETFVAPAAAGVAYTYDNMFSGCPKLVIYTPEESGLRTYAREQFLRCAPAQYQEMSALLDAVGQ